jgi:hypothetical protein
VSASRDSERHEQEFSGWLQSLHIRPDSDCYVITSPQWARPTTYSDALSFIASHFPQSEQTFVLAADFGWLITLDPNGVARFQRSSTI